MAIMSMPLTIASAPFDVVNPEFALDDNPSTYANIVSGSGSTATQVSYTFDPTDAPPGSFRCWLEVRWRVTGSYNFGAGFTYLDQGNLARFTPPTSTTNQTLGPNNAVQQNAGYEDFLDGGFLSASGLGVRITVRVSNNSAQTGRIELYELRMMVEYSDDSIDPLTLGANF